MDRLSERGYTHPESVPCRRRDRIVDDPSEALVVRTNTKRFRQSVFKAVSLPHRLVTGGVEDAAQSALASGGAEHDLISSFSYWAKSRDPVGDRYHALPFHGLDVAAVGTVILEQDPRLFRTIQQALGWDSDRTRCLIAFLLAIHDLGKFSTSFQSQDPELLPPGLIDAPSRHRHDVLGAILWQEVIVAPLIERVASATPGTAERRQAMKFWRTLTGPFFGHHGKPVDLPPAIHLGLEFPEPTRRAAQAFVTAAWRHFFGEAQLAPSDLKPPTDRVGLATWQIAGLAVLADWIGSDSTHFPFRASPLALDEYWERYALPSARKAVATAAIAPSAPHPSGGVVALFGPDFRPTPMQQAALNVETDDRGGLHIIEDTTGAGKTEAALILASNYIRTGAARGVYLGLPTMASANMIFSRVSQSYRLLFHNDARPSLALAHSRADRVDGFRTFDGSQSSSDGPYGRDGDSVVAECSAWIADSRKKALLAHVGVGSIDQALLAALPVRHQSLRIFGLSQKVLVVDEVHAYDARMVAILCRLLEYLGAIKMPVVLLSATLPQTLRAKLLAAYAGASAGETSLMPKSEDYPLLTTYAMGRLSEVAADHTTWSKRDVAVAFLEEEDQVMEFLSEAAGGGCACWIRNSVADAIRSYERTVSEFGGNVDVILFHARFTAFDRRRIEEEVVSRAGKKSTNEMRKGLLVIATQVVEQSLDLDFDAMVTDLCPIDLVIQRMGRLHRHPERERPAGLQRPTLVIHVPRWDAQPKVDWYEKKFPIGGYVYRNHARLWLTYKNLLENPLISVPADARRLVEAVYGDEAATTVPEGLRDSDDHDLGESLGKGADGDALALRLLTPYHQASAAWRDDELVKTRSGDPGVTLRLGVMADGTLNPLNGDGPEGWRDSEVSISVRKVGTAARATTFLDAVVEDTKRSMPDKGKWSLLVPLTAYGQSYRGEVTDEAGRRKIVCYSSRTGLTIEKGGPS